MNLSEESGVMRRSRVVHIPSRKEPSFANGESELLIPGAELAEEGCTLGIRVGKKICPGLWKLGTAPAPDTVF